MKYHLLLTLPLMCFLSCRSEKKAKLPDPRIELLEEQIGELQSELAHQQRLHQIDLEKIQKILAKPISAPAKVPVVKLEPQPVPVEKPATLPEPDLSELDVSKLRKVSRVKAVGEYHKVLDLTGRRFEDVTIVRVTDVGLEIQHQHGSARLRFSDLPREWRERFYFNPDAASRVLRQEYLAANRTERRIEQALAAQKKRLEEEFRREAERDHELALAEAKRPIEITKVSQPVSPPVVSRPRHTYSKTVVVARPEICLPRVRPQVYCSPKRVRVSRPLTKLPVYRPRYIPRSPVPVQRSVICRSR